MCPNSCLPEGAQVAYDLLQVECACLTQTGQLRSATKGEKLFSSLIVPINLLSSETLLGDFILGMASVLAGSGEMPLASIT